MIRMVQSKSAAQAKNYFRDALIKSDYYLDDQELNGTFQGKLAERLGITGAASKEVFFALCENRHPYTGDKLTPRTKDNRTTGYDINFHCPKSVSILHVLSKDDHILEAFRDSVTRTMQDIEAASKVRARKGGTYADRESGELAWVDFVHQTARPVKDFEPDPHLHAHCYVFNMTWDKAEKRVKAAQFRDINRDMPYFQTLFHKRLSDNLIKLGYQIKRTDKSFEIEGVPEKVLELFSKRTNEIGQIAREKGITDAKALDELGAKTRAKKQKGLTMQELKTEWRRQIQELETPKVERATSDPVIRYPSPLKQAPITAKQCADNALLHYFERASVVPYNKILARAYKYAMGNSSISAEDIAKELKSDSRIIEVKEKSQTLCTTKEVLREEKRMVDLARAGRGKMVPLFNNAPETIATGQQAEAIRHVLTTSDRVSIIRGVAGAGKTTLMQEAVSFMESKGKRVTTVAPAAQTSRGTLREEGFKQADTVAKLLLDKAMQDKLKDQVLWVDEAGLLGTKDMAALLDLATRQNARLILGGDTRQHASVVRGDALRILNTVAGVRAAEVNRIYRQRDGVYRSAVEDLSNGAIRDGFDKLDAMGAIREIDPTNPNAELVEDYVDAIKKGKKALVISPTHKQGESTTQAIREKLRDSGMIGKKEISVFKLTNLNLTAAEKNDRRNIREGQYVQFNQNGKRIKRGSLWKIESCTDKEILIRDRENITIMPLPEQSGNKFDLFRLEEMQLAKGDKIRITKNGFDREKKGLDNGQIFNVESVNKKGEISLVNSISKASYSIDRNFGHIAHAHCITSHAAQGKTVDCVFIAQPSATFPATNARQFYVSASRARESVNIYTDDKALLLAHAAKIGERQSAIELVNSTHKHIEHVHDLQRKEDLALKPQETPEMPRQPDKSFTYNKDDYEPSF